jgi:hypothetical protein
LDVTVAKRTHQLRVLLVDHPAVGGLGGFAAFGPERSAPVTVVDERVTRSRVRCVSPMATRWPSRSGRDHRLDVAERRCPEVAADGFHASPSRSRPSTPRHRVRLMPHTLRGVVEDPDGRPVEGVYVESGRGTAVSGRDGSFLVRLAEPGEVRVWRPAWLLADFEWDGGLGERTIQIEPRVVKAVHVTGEVAGDPERWRRCST